MRTRLLAVGAVLVVIAVVAILVRSGTSAATSNGAPRTPWGDPDLQGIWTDETSTPLQRAPRFANQEFFTEEQRAELDKAAIGAARPRQARGARHRARRRRRLQRGVRVRQAHRRAHVDDRRSAQWPHSADDAGGARRAWPPIASSVWRCCNRPRRARTSRSPAEAASTIRSRRRGARSRRRATTPQRMNRYDGPEDGSLPDRCLTLGLPEFGANAGSFRRIVQTPDGISIFYDVGQGQGWQRNIVMDGRPHLPPASASGTATRAAAGRATRSSST